MEDARQMKLGGIVIKREVSLGDLLMFGMVVAGMLVWGIRLEGRVNGKADTETVVRLEERIEATNGRLSRSETRSGEQFREIKSLLSEIRDEMRDKVDK